MTSGISAGLPIRVMATLMGMTLTLSTIVAGMIVLTPLAVDAGTIATFDNRRYVDTTSPSGEAVWPRYTRLTRPPSTATWP